MRVTINLIYFMNLDEGLKTGNTKKNVSKQINLSSCSNI